MRPTPFLLAAIVAAAPAFAHTTTLNAVLTGAAEAPGPGAPDGKGSAQLEVDPHENKICYVLTAAGADTPTAAHIHKGAVAAAGPVVVPFTAPTDGKVGGCAPVTAEIAKAIIATPGDYYVNVHTAAFPKGAMRGQLAK